MLQLYPDFELKIIFILDNFISNFIFEWSRKTNPYVM